MRDGQLNRIDRANALLRAIATTGRRFFSYTDGGVTRVSYFDRLGPSSRLWLIDAYTQHPVYLHHPPGRRWRGFTGGGTLQRLVVALRDFIRHGQPVSPGHFGPWPDVLCGGDLWGYGDDMAIVRQVARDLGIIDKIRATPEEGTQ